MRAEPNYPQVIIVGGPTATGKSAFAAALAPKVNGVIINADSQQLYREIPILSGAPTKDEQQNIPHHLFGVLSVAEPASAGRWRDMAIAEINSAIDARKTPIVVGGTGLYLRSLTEGIADIPEIPDSFRQNVRTRREEVGPEKFHDELKKLDPASGAKLSPGDTQRVLRAYEIISFTGKSQIEWQAMKGEKPPYRFFKIVLLPPRDEIYQACQDRFERMIQQGALAEAGEVEKLKLPDTLASTKALGIPSLRAHLRGEMELAAAIAQGKLETRQYAKRQYTWFKGHIKPDFLINKAFEPQKDQEILAKAVEKFKSYSS